MKAVSSQKIIDSLEKKVELHLQEAIKTFQNLPENILLRPSGNGGWSIAECLWHLNSYGDFYLPEIKKGLENNFQHNPEFKSSWLGNYFVNMMMPGEKSKKMKAFKDHRPPADLDAYAVVAEFIQQQEQLLGYLKKARKNDLNRIKIPISIAKWLKLNLGDVFRFLIAHDERHILQARRNLN